MTSNLLQDRFVTGYLEDQDALAMLETKRTADEALELARGRLTEKSLDIHSQSLSFQRMVDREA